MSGTAVAAETERAATGVSRRMWDRDLRLVLVLAFLVYAPAFWWGAPHANREDAVDAWAVDDETPLGPLAEVHNILEPKPDRNLGYPLFYSFVSAAAYAPYLAFQMLTGGLDAPTGEYPYGFRDPVKSLRTLSWIAHMVTVLMAAAMAGALFVAARARWDRATGFVAAALGGMAYPMLYYARTGNVDGPMLALTVMAVAAWVLCMVHGFTVRRAVWLGIFAGLALATKEAALGVFLVMPFALLVAPREGGLLRPALAGLGASLIALGAGSGFFVDPGRYIAHLQFLTGRLEVLSTGAAIPDTFDRSLAGSLAMARGMFMRLADGLTWPGLILAGGGAAWLALRRARGGALVLPALSYALYMFAVLRSVQLRYLLPLAVLLAFAAAPLITAAWRNRRAAWALPVLVLAGATLAIQLARSADLTWAMLRDSRHEAARWLAPRLQPGDVVAYFGPSQKLPRLPDGVGAVRVAEYGGMYVAPADQPPEILARLDSLGPRFILVVPDHTSHGREHSHTLPVELFDRLMAGEAGYRLEESFRTPPLAGWIRRPPLDYPTVNPPIRVFAAAQ